MYDQSGLPRNQELPPYPHQQIPSPQQFAQQQLVQQQLVQQQQQLAQQQLVAQQQQQQLVQQHLAQQLGQQLLLPQQMAQQPAQQQSRFRPFPKACVSFDDIMFMVDPRYQIRSRVGRGAQGVICSAIDLHSATRREIAIKKLPNALDEVMASKRLLRELRLLRHLKHENILSLMDIMLPPSTNVLLWKDVYIASELMDTDLNYVIMSGQELTRDHVQYFTAQLLSGIQYLHRCSVVHRDLKVRGQGTRTRLTAMLFRLGLS